MTEWMFEGQHEAARPTSAATKSPEARISSLPVFPAATRLLHFCPFLSPSRRRCRCSAPLSCLPTSSRCESRVADPAAAAMFSWILRGCRDECSASDQLKQVYLLPLGICFPPSNSKESGQESVFVLLFRHLRV